MEHDLSGDEEEARGKNGGKVRRDRIAGRRGRRDLQQRWKDSFLLFALKGICLPYQVALFIRMNLILFISAASLLKISHNIGEGLRERRELGRTREHTTSVLRDLGCVSTLLAIKKGEEMFP